MPTDPPLTRLGMKAAGRTRDGRADFVIGEKDSLYAYLKALSGAYTITAVTFQVKQGDVGVLPPNGSVNFTTPVAITTFSAAQGQTVQASAFLDTTNMHPGIYQAEFVISVTNSDGLHDVIHVNCTLYVNTGRGMAGAIGWMNAG